MEEWWNKRYKDEGFIWDKIPSECAKKSIPLFRSEKVKKVLDIPCGYGRDSIFLHREGYQVDAVDFSKHALEMFQDYQKEEDYEIFSHCRPAHNLHFEDGTYDAILSNRFINLLYEDDYREAVIDEMHRILKNDGILCLSTRCVGDPEEKSAIRKDGSCVEIDDREGHKVRFNSREEMIELLSKKFEIIDIHEISEPVTATRGEHCPLIYISAKKKKL
ncbi:MAG: class I SAM-dependent methyltransferase [Candidatus Altiarchaeota archaeon]